MKELTPIQKKFIVHWGEMGTTWGINRTVAQIHALLYISPEPLSADEIADVLLVARSNVSNSLHELLNWGIVKVTHVFGDRKDHYESMKDVCEMFRIILDQRKKREIDPTVKLLQDCIAEIDKSKGGDAYTKKQLTEFLNFFESMTQWYERLKILPIEKILGFLQLKKKP